MKTIVNRVLSTALILCILYLLYEVSILSYNWISENEKGKKIIILAIVLGIIINFRKPFKIL